MNLKISGLLFVLIVVTEAINDLALNSTSILKSPNKDLPAVIAQSEKSQAAENGGFEESGKISNSNNKILQPKDQNTVITPTTATPPPSPSRSPSPPLSTTTTSTTTTTTTTPPPPPTTPTTPTPTPSSPSPSTSRTLTSQPSIPASENDTWVVRDDKSKVCIIFKAVMWLNITYPGKNEEHKSFVINVPKKSNVTGNCSQDLQFMNVTWDGGYSLQINFSANKSEKTYWISELMLTVNASTWKDFNASSANLNFINKSSEFVTPLNMSYKCDKVQDLYLKNENEMLKAVLSLSGTQMEAYMNKTKSEFGAVQDCQTFDTPDVVPIAVGCALALLVVVVLMAYIIGRKRSQNRGYLSM